MPMPFLIQPANIKDLPDLNTIEQACFEDDAWPMVDLFTILILPGVIRYKAIVDGKMVGFASASVETDKKTSWINTLGVLPAYRRQGIAEALLEACEQKANTPLVHLFVRVSNQAAIELYQKKGYARVETRKGYYNNGEDAYIMEKCS